MLLSFPFQLLMLLLLGLSIASRIPAAISNTKAGIYVHVPFCRRRCFYCDFPVQAIGDRASTQAQHSLAYEQLLLREIAATRTFSLSKEARPLVDSIYLGGGTPSLLLDSSIEHVLSALRSTFDLSEDAEVTMEMDPGTFDLPRLNRLRGLGVTRVSVGVQAFDAAVLARLGRAHTVADVYNAVDALHASSIRNFNLDLISALPYLTAELWASTLHNALDCGSTHLSVYDLQVEEKTAFGRWFTPGSFPLPPEESCADMYRQASTVLRDGGFEHYEVSNYAKPGHRSRHNQKYWRLDTVYAFGMSATSYCRHVRFRRPHTMKSYSAWLDEVESGQHAMQELSDTDRADPVEFIMLALRTADGLSLLQLQTLYGEGIAMSVSAALQPFLGRGVVMRRGDVVCRLADPEGFLVSNDIISSILAALPRDLLK